MFFGKNVHQTGVGPTIAVAVVEGLTTETSSSATFFDHKFATSPHPTTLALMIAVTALLLILAALFIIVGGLGWAGKLPGNGVIGIRVPEVRKTKELWDTAHRIAGPLWTVSGVVLALGGILSFGASGWMWLVALAVVGSLALLGMGAGMGAHAVALIDARATAEAASDSGCDCCSSGASGASTSSTAGSDAHDPSVDCGVSGGCGSCSLNGACEGGSDAFAAGESFGNVDLDAVRKAAAKGDDRQYGNTTVHP